MKSIQKMSVILMAAAAITVLTGAASFASVTSQGIMGTADLIVLTPQHARAVAYDIDSLAGGAGSIHTSFIFTFGAGSLSVFIANNSPLSPRDECIFFVSGIIGTTPVLNYSYASSGISFAVAVPDVGFGVLFTGIIFNSGVDFPIRMIQRISLN